MLSPRRDELNICKFILDVLCKSLPVFNQTRSHENIRKSKGVPEFIHNIGNGLS